LENLFDRPTVNHKLQLADPKSLDQLDEGNGPRFT
jgi:hypothetical protein